MLNQCYTFQRQLASGQMSDVWLALDRQTSMQVAVKIMKLVADEQRNAKTAERFRREIDIAQELRHPQILPILDYGYSMTNDGSKRHVPYLVSPYIPEGSLVSLLQQQVPWQVWSLPQVADAILQAAECLWFLHTRIPPIVHEDVKPGNFLFRSINSSERAVLLYLFDFGISRRKPPSYALASEVVGTLEFMAPEQIQQQVDCATDQYALAVMASLLLTGQYPIQVEHRMDYVAAHQSLQPLLPSELSPERITSPEVDAIMLRALAKEPGRRFPTVLAFAQELQQAILAYERQHVAYAVTSTMSSTEPDSATLRVSPTSPTEVATRSHSRSRSATPVEERIAFSIDFDPPDTHDGRLLDEPLPVRPAKSGTLRQREPDPLSLSPLVSLVTPETVPQRQELPARAKLLCWSPDSTMLACVLYGAVAIFWPATATLQVLDTPNSQRATACCWSPDSTVLAIAGNRQISFYDVRAGKVLPLTIPCTQSTIEGLDWSVQGQLALWLDTQVLLFTVARPQWEQERVPAAQQLATDGLRCGNLNTLRFSPDGCWLAAGASNGAVLGWTLARPQHPLRLLPGAQKIQALAWSPDSSLLCAARKDSTLSGWQISTRQEVLYWSALPAMPRTLTISPSQQLTLASSEPRLLIGHAQASCPTHSIPGQLIAAWSPSGQLATLSEQNERTLVIWSVLI
jgi:serine/threonine protein kinase